MKKITLLLTIYSISVCLLEAQKIDREYATDGKIDNYVDTINRQSSAYKAKQHINFRGNLNNSRLIFEKEKVGRVAFLGGSITEMNGWHNQVMENLKKRFPDTKFEFIEAGIGSTGSTPGAFRMWNDVLSKGKVDLLFVEAAVNDPTNGFDGKAQIRGMEGEVRQALLYNPNMDIIMQHFVCEIHIKSYNSGQVPEVIKNHEKVAEYYQLPSINLAQEISERISSGEFDWKMFGGIHPAPFGHRFYVASINSLFDKMWSDKNAVTKVIPHKLPLELLDKFSYSNAKLIDPQKARIKTGWIYESPWIPKEKGSVRAKFKNIAMLEALTSGSELTFPFEGTAIGIYTLCGPNAGIIEYSIDGSPFKTYDLFTKWSKSLYIPWVHMFETELTAKKHEIRMKISEQKNKDSKGPACQIYYFAVNGIN